MFGEVEVEVETDVIEVPKNINPIKVRIPSSSPFIETPSECITTIKKIKSENNCQESSENVPKIIFIVPYRNREEHRLYFKTQMEKLLLGQNDYKIYYIHQCDTRTFNRGAMKNIGFLMVKNKYPESYKNISLVFNDVDTTPSDTGFITDYSTKPKIVKHFYGYTYALGGIVSITAGDFESINGFPNYWSWGYEDNMLNYRVTVSGLTLDRSVFYSIIDNRITQFKTGPERVVNRGEFQRYISRIKEGIKCIRNLTYNIDEDTGFVNVTHFDTGFECNNELNQSFQAVDKNVPFRIGRSGSRRCTMNLNI
jgi:hypothetical protein